MQWSNRWTQCCHQDMSEQGKFLFVRNSLKSVNVLYPLLSHTFKLSHNERGELSSLCNDTYSSVVKVCVCVCVCVWCVCAFYPQLFGDIWHDEFIQTHWFPPVLDFTVELIESWLNPPKGRTHTHTHTHIHTFLPKSGNFEGKNKCWLNKAIIFILKALTQSLSFVRAATLSQCSKLGKTVQTSVKYTIISFTCSKINSICRLLFFCLFFSQFSVAKVLSV